MKILYITSLGFRKASSASIRNISLINGIVENGCKVDFFTIKYPDEYEDVFLKKIISDKVRVFTTNIPIIDKYVKVKKTLKKENRINNRLIFNLKNIIKKMYYFPDIDKDWIKLAEFESLDDDYDIVISSSDSKTSHYVAEKFLEKYKCKWVQIWGDPWADDINLENIYKFRAIRAERVLISKANKIMYVSYPTYLSIIKKYEYKARDIEYLGRSYLAESSRKNIHEHTKWTFSYTGSINKYRNIEPLLKSIEIYNSDNVVGINLDIYGNCSSEVEELLLNYEFVNLYGLVNFEEIRNVYQNTDILVFMDNGINSTQIPGKLYDYFGTDRNILALVEDFDSEVYKFIRSTNRCIIQKNELNISFEFLKNMSSVEPLKEYSGKILSKKLLNS